MACTTRRSALVLLLLVILRTSTAFVITTSNNFCSRAAVAAAVTDNRAPPIASRTRHSFGSASAAARGTETRMSAATGFFESLFSGLKTEKKTDSKATALRLSEELFSMLTAEGAKPDDVAVIEKIEELEAVPGVSFNRDAMYDGPWRVLWKTNTAWQRYFDPLKSIADNRAYQWYKEDGSVTNVAQALGDKLYVTVDGQGAPASPSTDLPYQINVEVSRGWLNALGNKIPLNFIKGTGSTFVVYIDEKLRVFRSDTGGIVVQTKANEVVPV
ncbi:unnamed protein product [Pylaiella littoralis]